MKKLFYLLNGLLITAALAACSSDYDDPPEQPNSHQNEVSVDSVDITQDEGASKDYTVISTVPVSEEVKAFFDEALPYLPDLHLEVSPFSFQSNANSEFYVINNEKELQNIYKGEKTLPQLDFENNTLIIGQLPMSGGSFLEAIYIRVYGDGNVLTIQTWEPPYQYSALYHMYFWGIFPKMLEEIDNNILWLNTKM
ncbi:MAG: hypothetical protein IJJ98_02800 [Prevotella sp.]|nr:hypothetical protein [Prevotella sp.]